MNTEQQILDAFERGKAFGFAEGMRSKQAEVDELKKQIVVKERDYNFMKDLAIGEEARAKELEEALEECTCQGGHSEAYLKAKGRK